MIVKYRKDNIWCYLDKVNLTATKDINADELIEKYDDDIREGRRIDTASYKEELTELLPDDIIASNKVFTMATELKEEWPEYNGGDNSHCVNLIDGDMALKNYPATVVLIYRDYSNTADEFKITALVTNQTVYLMNDEGKTIERLV